MEIEVWPTNEQIKRAEAELIAETGFSEPEIAEEKAYCMCGDPIEGHTSPMDSGHTPTVAWDYRVFCRASEIAGAENG